MGLALLALCLTRSFEGKRAVLAALCLFFGLGTVIRSLSRELSQEDRIEERDERSRLVRLSSRSAAFAWSEGACFLCLIASMLGWSRLGDGLAAPLCLAFSGLLAVMILSHLAAVLYYEHRL